MMNYACLQELVFIYSLHLNCVLQKKAHVRGSQYTDSLSTCTLFMKVRVGKVNNLDGKCVKS